MRTSAEMAGNRPAWRKQGPRLGGGRGRIAFALLLLPLALGCAPRGRESPFHRPVREETMTLRVENRNVHDADIYIRPSGRRRSLGTVSSRAVQFFEVPWDTGVPLDLEIELIVGERYRLPPIPATRGGRVELTIGEELRESYVRY